MVVGVNGSGTRPLGDQDTMNSDSSWSPDGNFISFQHGTDCCGDQLVIADVHTGRERTIGYFDGNDSRPDWAPLAS
jgi:Tol biopolymer transport system component